LLELLLQFIHYNIVASPRVSALSAIRAAVAATTCGKLTAWHHNSDCVIGSSASRLLGVPRLVVLLWWLGQLLLGRRRPRLQLRGQR
jgi:hypothetical protein